MVPEPERKLVPATVDPEPKPKPEEGEEAEAEAEADAGSNLPKAINSVGSIFSILASKHCNGCSVAFSCLRQRRRQRDGERKRENVCE